VLLLPLVLCARFPTQDGPTHIENAAILIRLHDPGAGHLRRYYTLSDRLDPTWLGHLALAGLVAGAALSAAFLSAVVSVPVGGPRRCLWTGRRLTVPPGKSLARPGQGASP
jgi:hypothetical protein